MHTPIRTLKNQFILSAVLVTLVVVTPCAGADVGATSADAGSLAGALAGAPSVALDEEVQVMASMDDPNRTDAPASTSDVTLPLEPPVGAADAQPTTTAAERDAAGANGTAGTDTSATPPPPVPAGGSVLSDPVARDRAVEAALRTFLGNPTGLTVSLVADEAGRSGSYKEISLRLRNSKVRGLSIASLWIRLTDCAVSLARLAASGTLQFTDPGKADLVGVVAEASMNEALTANARSLRMERPSLDFEPGFLRFRGRMNVPLFHRDVDVKGTLEISGGTKVMFRPRWMYVDSAKLPGFVMRALADKINPLADFSVFRFDVTLAALETTDDALLAATEGMRGEMERLRVLGLSAGAGTVEPLPPVTQ